MRIRRDKPLTFHEDGRQVWAVLEVDWEDAKPLQINQFRDLFDAAAQRNSMAAAFDRGLSAVLVLLPLGLPEQASSVLQEAMDLFDAVERSEAPSRRQHQKLSDQVKVAATEWWGLPVASDRPVVAKRTDPLPWQLPPSDQARHGGSVAF